MRLGFGIHNRESDVFISRWCELTVQETNNYAYTVNCYDNVGNYWG